jgi:hypothetical protein
LSHTEWLRFTSRVSSSSKYSNLEITEEFCKSKSKSELIELIELKLKWSLNGENIDVRNGVHNSVICEYRVICAICDGKSENGFQSDIRGLPGLRGLRCARRVRRLGRVKAGKLIFLTLYLKHLQDPFHVMVHLYKRFGLAFGCSCSCRKKFIICNSFIIEYHISCYNHDEWANDNVNNGNSSLSIWLNGRIDKEYLLDLLSWHMDRLLDLQNSYNFNNFNNQFRNFNLMRNTYLYSHFEPVGNCGANPLSLIWGLGCGCQLKVHLHGLFDLQNSYEFCIYFGLRLLLSSFLFNSKLSYEFCNEEIFYYMRSIVYLMFNVFMYKISMNNVFSTNIFSLYNHETVYLGTPKVALDNRQKNSQWEAWQE